MDGTICYLNTDLDLTSSDDLTALAAVFESRGVFPLHVTRGEDGLWYATFEMLETGRARATFSGRSGASAASLAPFLLRDELAVARRVLEGGEADRRGAPPPRAPPAGRDRGRRAHEPAEDERPDAAAPAVLVHGGIVGSAACGSARSETSCST